MQFWSFVLTANNTYMHISFLRFKTEVDKVSAFKSRPLSFSLMESTDANIKINTHWCTVYALIQKLANKALFVPKRSCWLLYLHSPTQEHTVTSLFNIGCRLKDHFTWIYSVCWHFNMKHVHNRWSKGESSYWRFPNLTCHTHIHL